MWQEVGKCECKIIAHQLLLLVNLAAHTHAHMTPASALHLPSDTASLHELPT
jgi:hypothetical protein